MSYKTYFILDVFNANNVNMSEVYEYAVKSGFDFAKAFKLEGNTLCSTEAISWDSYSEELTQISLRFSNTIFSLRGQGEGAGDLWISYFYNGTEQRYKAKITCPAFNNNRQMVGWDTL